VQLQDVPAGRESLRSLTAPIWTSAEAPRRHGSEGPVGRRRAEAPVRSPVAPAAGWTTAAAAAAGCWGGVVRVDRQWLRVEKLTGEEADEAVDLDARAKRNLKNYHHTTHPDIGGVFRRERELIGLEGAEEEWNVGCHSLNCEGRHNRCYVVRRSQNCSRWSSCWSAEERRSRSRQN